MLPVMSSIPISVIPVIILPFTPNPSKEDRGLALQEDEEESPILQYERAGKEGGSEEKSDDALQNVREYFFRLPLEEQEKVENEVIKKLPE